MTVVHGVEVHRCYTSVWTNSGQVLLRAISTRATAIEKIYPLSFVCPGPNTYYCPAEQPPTATALANDKST
ncbi:hypothetical protein BX592_13447 [Paraburkholderia rhizosphaerae]|uniref:Uncharacterized protein n=1 Tax=Paraburkholderia rhizosphaerae TaxID=480658 RepID=A0A4R8L5J0_9BURK|nr:hypothetical protein BX592_13447 [Paraburkholderia rhizosphaerae]